MQPYKSLSSKEAVVLIGFAEALSAPEVVWSLIDAGFMVNAFARRGQRSALRHCRHVTVKEVTPPELDAQAAVADLHSLIRSSKASAEDKRLVLFPLDDNAVWLCSRLLLEPGCVLAGPSGNAAELALDKYIQTQAARAAGFNVPGTTLLMSIDDLHKADLVFPLILKPAKAVWLHKNRFWKSHAWVCANSVELERAVTQWQGRMPLLAQPYILGTGGGVFGLAADEGIRAWSAHRRLRMMNPQGSGSSACISQVVPENLKPAVEQLIRQTRWRGLFMIELLRDRAGTEWFVEFNGRPWGSIALSRRQALEYPAWNVKLALDPRSPVGRKSLAAANIVCRNLAREFMHLLFVLRGPKSEALREWPSFWTAIAEVLRIRRGDCIYNWRRDDPTVLISDFYYTIHDSIFKSRN